MYAMSFSYEIFSKKEQFLLISLASLNTKSLQLLFCQRHIF